jgi:hypothetical protein
MTDNVPVITLSEYHRRENDLEGLCVACGATVPGVEVDAEGYDCPSCEEPQVQGILSALENGQVLIEGAEGGFL